MVRFFPDILAENNFSHTHPVCARNEVDDHFLLRRVLINDALFSAKLYAIASPQNFGDINK